VEDAGREEDGNKDNDVDDCGLVPCLIGEGETNEIAAADDLPRIKGVDEKLDVLGSLE
jgi:hypothetical protein